MNLVTCLNDFDRVELVENSVDASGLSSDVISPDYQEGVPIVKVKGSLKRISLLGAYRCFSFHSLYYCRWV